jgi:hypothetical protein
MNMEDSKLNIIENQHAQIQLLIKNELHMTFDIPLVLVDLIIEYHNYVGIYIVSGTTDQPCGQIANAAFRHTRNMPLPDGFDMLNNFSVSRSEHHLYVTGGGDSYLDYPNRCTNSFSIYDMTLSTWTKGPPLLTMRIGHRSEIVDNKLYVIGGHSDNNAKHSHINSMEIFDLTTNYWVTGPSMKVPRSCHFTCVIGKKIYVFGSLGRHDIEMFDTETDTWHSLKSMPTERRNGHAIVRYSDDNKEKSYKIIVLGGMVYNDYIETIDEYDVQTNTWSTLKIILPEFYPFSAWVDNATCTLHLAFGLKVPKGIFLCTIFAISNHYKTDRKYEVSTHCVHDLSSESVTWTRLTDYPILLKRLGYCL